MRVLLDESLPRRLAAQLEGVSAETVVDRGWSGLKNGELLRTAAEEFDAFLTADQSLPHQQNISSFALRIVVLAGRTNRLEDLLPLIPAALAELTRLSEGEFGVDKTESTKRRHPNKQILQKEASWSCALRARASHWSAAESRIR